MKTKINKELDKCLDDLLSSADKYYKTEIDRKRKETGYPWLPQVTVKQNKKVEELK